MDSIAILILAAGQGKRMGSSLPKVLHPLAQKPLLHHVLSAALDLEPTKVSIVTGHKRELVEESVQKAFSSTTIGPICFAHQPSQQGTGDAVRCGLEHLRKFVGTILILYGDMPLLNTETLERLLKEHTATNATISLLTCSSPRLLPYGRIVRGEPTGEVAAIVEARDCSPSQLAIREYNVGVYAVDSSFLIPAVDGLENKNAQGEYYLTDIIGKAASEGQRIHAVALYHEEELLGVNDLYDLHLVEKVLNQKRIRKLILSGVTIVNEDSVWIDPDVQVQSGCFIGPQVQLRGKTILEANVRIEGSSYLEDVEVHRDAIIKLGVRAEKSIIGPSCQVGPFAHLREGTSLGNEVKIGNFVETKKALLAPGAKASHLSYLGDCSVGENSNIGAGTITCNYDGYSKHVTTIGKNCFIGSDSVLIAPVTIDDGAYVGAGSAISKDVESGALAFTRAPLVIKSGWARRRAARCAQSQAHKKK